MRRKLRFYNSERVEACCLSSCNIYLFRRLVVETPLATGNLVGLVLFGLANLSTLLGPVSSPQWLSCCLGGFDGACVEAGFY
jgi:hypothetical protein